MKELCNALSAICGVAFVITLVATCITGNTNLAFISGPCLFLAMGLASTED